MIAEATDTVFTLGWALLAWIADQEATGVIAYVVLVIALAALLCCHQGEGPPPGARLALRVLRRPRPSWAHGPISARRYAHHTRQETS